MKKKIIWPNPVKFNAAHVTAGAVTMSAPDGATCPKEATDRGIAWFAKRGCNVKLAPHYFGNAGFLAGTPKEIAADVNAMVGDDATDFIVSAGGGYNANALLPYLDYELIAGARKPIVGLSNPTVILNAISATTGLVTYHGPVLIHNFGNETPIDDFTESHFLEIMSGNGDVVVKAEPDWSWLRAGETEGRLYGGNLWSLEHLLGTPWEPDWDGAILFVEDCFCELHQVYASLEHLKAAGVFEKINGMIVGIPLEVAEAELPYQGTFNDVVMDVVNGYSFPVLANVHLGHTDRKLTLPIGAHVRLDSRAHAIFINRKVG